MSYARFGWDNSDVYVYLHCNGYLDCCACILTPWGSAPVRYLTTADMLAHLDGHTVPADTRQELAADADENDAWIAAQ